MAGNEITVREGWFRTYLGGRFDPLNPTKYPFHIRDIAHVLARKCRFGGNIQTKEFYSVAEHSVYVAYQVPRDLRLAALLHDANEFPLPDVMTPTKIRLPNYSDIENSVDVAVAQSFGFHPVLFTHPAVKAADRCMLINEMRQLFLDSYWWIEEPPEREMIIEGLLPFAAETLFLKTFNTLSL